MINYHNKKFKAVTNSSNGEVGQDTLFSYYQQDRKLWGTYRGGEIEDGHLLGHINDDGSLEFFYHHINQDGVLMAGKCHSNPKYKENGKLILYESWQWFSGDKSSGTSLLEEVL